MNVSSLSSFRYIFFVCCDIFRFVAVLVFNLVLQFRSLICAYLCLQEYAQRDASWLSWAFSNLVVLDARSEEHTSELQSHYSISYAVLCLKKIVL